MDDSVPPADDEIAGFGAVGLGTEGLVACPVALGARCLSDATCLFRTADFCAGIGGAFGAIGSDCAPNPCAQPEGACCLPEGSGEIRRSADCRPAMDIWLGAGAAREPNPCNPTLRPLRKNWGWIKNHFRE